MYVAQYKFKQDHIIKFGIFLKNTIKQQRIPLQLEESSKQPHMPVDHFPLVGSCGAAIFWRWKDVSGRGWQIQSSIESICIYLFDQLCL